MSNLKCAWCGKEEDGVRPLAPWANTFCSKKCEVAYNSYKSNEEQKYNSSINTMNENSEGATLGIGYRIFLILCGAFFLVAGGGSPVAIGGGIFLILLGLFLARKRKETPIIVPNEPINRVKKEKVVEVSTSSENKIVKPIIKQYYIHNGVDQTGPFLLEDLKLKDNLKDAFI